MQFSAFRFILSVFVVVVLSCPARLSAQCGVPISTFPYTEDFETGQGGWASGGTLNDWAWGTPSKPVIHSAGSGTKCWIVGSLATSFYNYGERSYVTSPCFDFTNLQHPFIVFLIFWESEHTYDGTNLQYSTDAGTTWNNVGAFGDPADCMNQNWYNTSSVTYLAGLATNKNGWTGNIQPDTHNANGVTCQGGGGSDGWKLASHCLANLAGQPSVMFRFTFGAGTTCNNFDGIAFDSVSIAEAPPNAGDFTYTCSDSNTVSFTGTPSLCPNNFLWNFGDTTSGASNTASTLSATHVFSAPGSYNITLTLSGPCNAPVTITKTIDILNVSYTATNGSCSGGAGGINVTASGGTGPYTYDWGNGVTGQNRTGLSAGTYSVTVSEPQSCSIVANITISGNSGISANTIITGTTCFGDSDGSITITPGGGTNPYHYLWANGDTSQSLGGLSPGTYNVTVTDSSGKCSATISPDVTSPQPVSIALSITGQCSVDSSVGINSSVQGGTPPYSYLWSTGSSNQDIANVNVGQYFITATDSHNCTGTDSITINPILPVVITDSAKMPLCPPLSDGSITVSVTGGIPGYSYLWSNHQTTATASGLKAGDYYITVTDARGCTYIDSFILEYQYNLTVGTNPDTTINLGQSIMLTSGTNINNDVSYDWIPTFWLECDTCETTMAWPTQTIQYYVTATDTNGCIAKDSVKVTVIPEYNLFIPNAFTPNGDGNNDYFELFGNKQIIVYLDMKVFNGIGELVFESHDINFQWDGTYKGKLQNPGVFVYLAEVTFSNGYTRTGLKGSVTLIR